MPNQRYSEEFKHEVLLVYEDVFRIFHSKMSEQEGSIGDQKFIRLLLHHLDIGIESLSNALLEEEKTHVSRYKSNIEQYGKLIGG